MEINFRNIKLRTAQLEDSEMLMKWWNDGEVMEHAGFPKGIGTSKEGIQENILEFTMPFSEFFIIEIDGIPVGELSYRIKDNAAYPGWKICDSTYQNKGYGPQIILMLFHYIFSRKDVNVQAIRWDTMLENKRAQYVYEEKIKARKTKVVENSFVDQLGRSRTSIWYELTKDEFYSHPNSSILVKEMELCDENEVKKTAVLIYNSFCNFEFSVALECLALAKREIVVFAKHKYPVKSEEGLTVLPDRSVSELNIEEFDSLVLTGVEDIREAAEDSEIIDFIRKFEKKIIGAISIAPVLLLKANLLIGKPFMAGVNKDDLYEEGFSEEDLSQMIGWNENLRYPVERGYIITDNIITSVSFNFVPWGLAFARMLGANIELKTFGI